MAKTDERFIQTYSHGIFATTEVWVDKVTGVNYLFIQNGNAGGLTPLLNRDGKPVITAIPISE